MSAAKSLITAEQLPEVCNGRRVELVRGDEEVPGEEVLPGFTVRLSELFS